MREAAAAEIQFEIAENAWMNAVERVSKIEGGASEVTSEGKQEGGGGKGEGEVPVEVEAGVVGDGKKKKKNRKKKKKKKKTSTDKEEDDDDDDDDGDDDDAVDGGDCDKGAKSPSEAQFRRVMIEEVESSSGSEDAEPSPKGKAKSSPTNSASAAVAGAAAPAAPAPAAPASASAVTSASRANTLQKGEKQASQPGMDAQVAKALISELAGPEARSKAASVPRVSKATSSVGKETGAVEPLSPFKRVDIVVDDDEDDDEDDKVAGDGGAGVRAAASPGDRGFKRVEILEEDSEDDDDEVKEAHSQQKPPRTSATTTTTATCSAASASTLPHVEADAVSIFDLSGQYAGDEQVTARIADLMNGPGAGKVTTLQLSGNDLTSVAATYILAEACPKMPWITSLVLHDNRWCPNPSLPLSLSLSLLSLSLCV